MYETLLTKEECLHAEDLGNFFRVSADQRDLNYDKYVIEGSETLSGLEEFNSDNTTRLNEDEVIEKLLSLQYVQNEVNMWRKP